MNQGETSQGKRRVKGHPEAWRGEARGLCSRFGRAAQQRGLYALAGTSPPKPGLVFDGGGAGGIEVEV